ncbi:MAG: aldo/keto reductase [Candidatus Sumerlaeia bacterium]
MECRKFGNTGMDVSVLGYGAMELRHDEVDDGVADRLLNEALDAGINFIDTAPDYGKSEDVIGRVIANRRDDYYLATKCGCNVPPKEGAEGHIYTGEQLRHNIEHSLKRLKTDYVDVWQIHSASPEQIEESDMIETMEKIRDEGKVRHIAHSFPQGRGTTYGHEYVLKTMHEKRFEAIQIWYSALMRVNENQIQKMAADGKGMILRGTVRSVMGKSYLEAFDEVGLDDLLDEGESPSQFLLRYAIANRSLHTTIVGTKSLDHLEENILAVEKGPISSDVLDEANKRLEAKGIVPKD